MNGVLKVPSAGHWVFGMVACPAKRLELKKGRFGI